MTGAQLVREIFANPASEVIRQLAIALPAVTAASAGLIALPITLNRLPLTHRQTQADEEGLITDCIDAAVLGLGVDKTVKITEERQHGNPAGVLIHTLERAKKNLVEHILVMEILCAFVRQNCKRELKPDEIYELGFDYFEIDPFSIPPIVINTVLSVIGRRNEQQIKTELYEKFTLFVRLPSNWISFFKCKFSKHFISGKHFMLRKLYEL